MGMYQRIGRPEEAFNVISPQMYRSLHAAILHQNTQQRPRLNWPVPFELITAAAHAEIRQGRWVVPCVSMLYEFPCQDFASYDPDWKLACCLRCGAVYEGVQPPDDWKRAEEILMRRPREATRNWWIPPGAMTMQPLEELIDENKQNGVA